MPHPSRYLISLWVEPSLYEEFRLVCFQQGRKLTDCGKEALHLWLSKAHGPGRYVHTLAEKQAERDRVLRECACTEEQLAAWKREHKADDDKAWQQIVMQERVFCKNQAMHCFGLGDRPLLQQVATWTQVEKLEQEHLELGCEACGAGPGESRTKREEEGPGGPQGMAIPGATGPLMGLEAVRAGSGATQGVRKVFYEC